MREERGEMSRICFVFPGQGAQYRGMGKELFDNYEECREVYLNADKALQFNISELCFYGSEEELSKTENTQPAILTTSIALLRILENKGIKAQVAAGLSLGEYSALVCSKVLDFETAVRLVKKRGGFMQEAVPQNKGAMAAIIGLKASKVDDIIKTLDKKYIVEVANYNCIGQTVIAGEIDGVRNACEVFKQNGALKTVMLSVSGPFHTSMMLPAAQKLKTELLNIKIEKLDIPVVTNVTGDFIVDKDSIKDNLVKQVMSSVKWEQSIRKLIEFGIDTFVEIGPGKTLSTFVRKIDRSIKTYNVEDLKSLDKTVSDLRMEN